ncbi:hypothetical protein [Streptomyces sp. NBC_00038]|nr:hypothetical protein [Streptomyces sp. NBC_00038]
MRLDWIRWTMRTGPLVDALIEHLVGDLGRYALEKKWLSCRRGGRCPGTS